MNSLATFVIMGASLAGTAESSAAIGMRAVASSPYVSFDIE
jgi:hypothetical protein